MKCCRCPAPPARAHGCRRRNRTTATGLPRQRRRLSGDLLDLQILRPRTTLLQPRLPRPSPPLPTPFRQQPPPAERRRQARSSRPATRLPAAGTGSGDGSRFPFGHFPGIIRVWDVSRNTKSHPDPYRAGKTARSVAALPSLRPRRTFRRSFPAHSKTKVSSIDDPPRNPRRNSPLFLRRALDDRHHRPRTRRSSRHRPRRH